MSRSDSSGGGRGPAPAARIDEIIAEERSKLTPRQRESIRLLQQAKTTTKNRKKP